MLTGEGADELFLGYNRYRVTAWNERLGRLYRSGGAGRARQRRGRERFQGRRPGSAVSPSELSRARARTPELFLENFAVFSEAGQATLARPALTCLGARDPYAVALAVIRGGAGRDCSIG